jgi:aspartate aminotransferase-like enzyme
MSELVRQEVAALERLDLHQLRAGWQERYGPPPRFRSAELFRLMFAFRLQAGAHGGIDAATRKTLARSGAVEAEGRHLGVGATLHRQWQGRDVTVLVTEEGFQWDERTFRSLTAVATAIAGSKWNGPRFFGLRP